MINEDQLKAILNSEIDNAIGFWDGELQVDREEAFQAYLGSYAQSSGRDLQRRTSRVLASPNVPGRSSVVTSDVMDTIEWILPQVLKAFVSSSRAVEFDAVSEEDEEAAAQETSAVNHVFYQKNPWFLILLSWFKDAMIHKNGVVKIYWDESETSTEHEYKELDDLELAELASNRRG